MNIILASQSARRKQLLSWLIEDFEISPSHLDEAKFLKLARTPEELVIKLAQTKAHKIAATNGIKSDSPSTLIIAADTIAALGNPKGFWEIVGKPESPDHAREILQKLKGQTHTVYTGICMLEVHSRKLMTDFDISEVIFKPFSDEAMEAYIATGQPMDKAGAYGIQEIEDEFIEGFTGSFTNIVGFPVKKVVTMFEYFEVALNPNWQVVIKNETGYDD